MTAARVRTRPELRRQRRPRSHGCWNHLLAAPLWPEHGVDLGTLLRTCDAVGACMAVPRRPWVPDALNHGNTLRHRQCVHWIDGRVDRWLARQRDGGAAIVGVELTDESIRLADLPVARERTVIVLGHESTGIPPEGLELLDVAVEIPMAGTGHKCRGRGVAGALQARRSVLIR